MGVAAAAAVAVGVVTSSVAAEEAACRVFWRVMNDLNWREMTVAASFSVMTGRLLAPPPVAGGLERGIFGELIERDARKLIKEGERGEKE